MPAGAESTQEQLLSVLQTAKNRLEYLTPNDWTLFFDRAKDMLIRGGENIYCVEVENALHEHPSVLDAAVVGLSHLTLGEEPAAWPGVAMHSVNPTAVAAISESSVFFIAQNG